MGTWHRVEIIARIEQDRFGFVVTREGNERGAEQALRCADAPVVFEEGTATARDELRRKDPDSQGLS